MTEAWRDSTGLIWVYQFQQGLERYVDATQFCASYGMRLPTEAEFTRLRSQMGFGTRAGYTPQAFVLYLQNKYPNQGTNYFWTGTAEDAYSAKIFRTENGFFYRGETDDKYYSVMCVTQ